MFSFSSDEYIFLKVHCGGLHRDDVLRCAINSGSDYFGRGIIKCAQGPKCKSLVNKLINLGYEYTILSESEAEGLLNLPDKFVKTFVVDWYEKEARVWARYKKGDRKS